MELCVLLDSSRRGRQGQDARDPDGVRDKRQSTSSLPRSPCAFKADSRISLPRQDEHSVDGKGKGPNKVNLGGIVVDGYVCLDRQSPLPLSIHLSLTTLSLVWSPVSSASSPLSPRSCTLLAPRTRRARLSRARRTTAPPRTSSPATTLPRASSSSGQDLSRA